MISEGFCFVLSNISPLMYPRKSFQGFNHQKTSSQAICQYVGVHSQTIFQDYRCTYKVSISYFGRLYIGQEHIIFLSNMFGVSNKIAIPIESISALSEPELKSIALTGKREGKSDNQDFLFLGLGDSHAFRIINALWRRQKLEPSMMGNSEQKSEEEHDREMGLDNSQMEINVFKQAGADKESIKKLEIVFPCTVDQFYQFFLADDAPLYSRKKHLEAGKAHSIKVTSWQHNEQLKAETRQISAVIKVKGVPLLSEARMSQVWLLQKEEGQLNIKVVTNMGDVPYHSYFNCQQNIFVKGEGQSRCRYTVNTAVIFNKNTYMKDFIINKTFSDFNQEYQIWVNNVKQLLDQKRKEIEQFSKLKERKKLGKSLSTSVEFESIKQSLIESDPPSVGEVKQEVKNGQMLTELRQLKQQVLKLKETVRSMLYLLIVLTIVMGIACWISLNIDAKSSEL